VKSRLDQAGRFLRRILEALLAARAQSQALAWPGRFIRIADGTSLSQPGSRGSDWHVHAVFDLASGSFSHLELTDRHGGESLECGEPEPGEIRIADRNYASAARLRAFLLAGQGQADVIVRVGWKALRLRRPDGTPFDLIAHLQSLPQDHLPHEAAVLAETGKGQPPLALRLVILRKPQAATEAARQAMRRAAPRKQKKLDPRNLIAAEFLILATSLPAEGYPGADVLAAYRLRWQVELAIKRTKSLLHMDEVPTHTPKASQSWLYAHLVLALLCDDMSQDVLAFFPSGPARRRLSALAVAGPETRASRAARGDPRPAAVR
jgi:Transposase DDE domain